MIQVQAKIQELKAQILCGHLFQIELTPKYAKWQHLNCTHLLPIVPFEPVSSQWSSDHGVM